LADFISLTARDGTGKFMAYAVEPCIRPTAAIVIIQEVFGVNPNIRRICHRWSEHGYLTIAPDLFWRLQAGVELNREIPEELGVALDLMRRFDTLKGLEDIAAAIDYARQEVTKVGVLGFCLGGRLAYLSATRGDPDASVLFYGNIEDLLGSASSLTTPFQAHFAGDDHVIPPRAVETVRNSLTHKRNVSIFEYPGVEHGFAGEFGPRRNASAADLANDRARHFFQEHLRAG
jgi:carboxymethylenebutenolidase